MPSPYPTAGLCPKTLHLDLVIPQGNSIQVLPAVSFWKRERYRLSYRGWAEYHSFDCFFIRVSVRYFKFKHEARFFSQPVRGPPRLRQARAQGDPGPHLRPRLQEVDPVRQLQVRLHGAGDVDGGPGPVKHRRVRRHSGRGSYL